MKVMTTVSPAAFELFQKQNMDPALELIGTSLTKTEKRKQVAARMLGFNAFEAMSFENDMYGYHPKRGELLVAKHPEMQQYVVFITQHSLMMVSHYGDVYATPGGSNGDPESVALKHQICVNDITEAFMKTLVCQHRVFECEFEPSHIELGFDGVKLFDIGVQRMARRRLEFDIVARNGIVTPLAVTAITSYNKKPTPTYVQMLERFDFSLLNSFEPEGKNTRGFWLIYDEFNPNETAMITRDMVLWELKQMRFTRPWSTQTHLISESLDCVRIAYEFLDAQNKLQTKLPKRSINAPLAELARRWAGRYISKDDMSLAIRLHPDTQGHADNHNISVRHVFPSYTRLKEIDDAGKHQNYNFYENSGDTSYLRNFGYIESENDEGVRVTTPRDGQKIDSVQLMHEKQREFFSSRKVR